MEKIEKFTLINKKRSRKPVMKGSRVKTLENAT